MESVIELVLGDTVLRLDGTVVELLHNSGVAHRWHVTHVAVEAKPHKGGVRFKVGIDVGGTVFQPNDVDVPAERVGEAQALFQEAVRRRDAIRAT